MIWLITLLAVGIVSGWLVSSLTEGRGLGLMGSLIVGVIGSFVGGFLFSLVGVRLVGEGPVYIVSLLAAMVGAVLLLILVGLLKK